MALYTNQTGKLKEVKEKLDDPALINELIDRVYQFSRIY